MFDLRSVHHTSTYHVLVVATKQETLSQPVPCVWSDNTRLVIDNLIRQTIWDLMWKIHLNNLKHVLISTNCVYCETTDDLMITSFESNVIWCLFMANVSLNVTLYLNTRQWRQSPIYRSRKWICFNFCFKFRCIWIWKNKPISLAVHWNA